MKFSFTTSLVLTALLSTTSFAQSDLERENYPEFAERMDLWGYAWESFKTTTEDGYILTTLRVTENLVNQRLPNPEYKPVIMVNGYECDGTSWIPNELGDVSPTALHLFDDGFDVYLMSNRGTKYCQEHTTYDVLSKEFWDFSFNEMGIYDDKAIIKDVKARTGVDNVNFIGYSMGSQQILYALAEIEDEIADDLHTVATMAPCTLSEDYVEASVYENGVFKFWDDEIYNLGDRNRGEDWWSTLDFICENYPENVCNYASGYGYAEPVAVKGEMYGGQQHLIHRFQEFAPNYAEGQIITPLIPLYSISIVPVTFWTSELDTTCSHAAAVDAYDEIGERVVEFTTVDGATHALWGRPLEEPIYGMLKESLINPESQSFNLDELMKF